MYMDDTIQNSDNIMLQVKLLHYNLVTSYLHVAIKSIKFYEIKFDRGPNEANGWGIRN